MKRVQDGQFDPFTFQQRESVSGQIEPVEVVKPWGREIWHVFTEKFALKTLEINPGNRFSLQHHVKKEEAWLVQSGQMELQVGPDPEELTTLVLHPGDVFWVCPGTVHRAKAIGTDTVVIIEVSTPELDDVVRHQDDFGRQGGSGE